MTDASEAIARLRELHKRVDEIGLAKLDEEATLLNSLPALLEIARLAQECADDLETEVKSRWVNPDGSIHPALQRKFDRDMSPVIELRAALQALAEGGE